MKKLNTMLSDLSERDLNTFRHYANIHMIESRSRKGEGYKLNIDNGLTIGGVKKVDDNYLMYFFDNDHNKLHFSSRTNQIIDEIKNIAEKTKSGELRNFTDKIPKYYAKSKRRLKSQRTTRIFQPINNSKSEYWEITNKRLGERIITEYRKVNITFI